MKRAIQVILLLFVVIVVACGAFSVGKFWGERTHGNVEITTLKYIESAKELQNPNRGFYQMYGFVISEQEEEYISLVKQRINDDKPYTIYLIQINLCRFRGGAISAEGMQNIERLFATLRKQKKQYIVRFLYDWDGKGQEAEPESIDIVLTHIKQLEGIFKEYQDIIFVHQGIFVGNYGEMNGSKYLSTEHMQMLIKQLADVTMEETFLAVRTPVHWRKITQLSEIGEIESVNSYFANRLSLYNDGMLGTEQDCGTYGVLNKEEAGDFVAWEREDELAFQSELCKIVPNGGEVIIDNPLNDFENTVKDLKRMHVTYLNQGYDANVLNKWASTIVTLEGCYNGMDGFSYIERHLGYRLLLNKAEAVYDIWKDTLLIDLTLQNVGFAPIYKNPELYLILQNEETKDVYCYQMSGDIRGLVGGPDADELLGVSLEISLRGYAAGRYQAYFYMKDVDSDMHIQLANEQEEMEWGYPIGTIQMDIKENLWKALEKQGLNGWTY